MTHSILITGPAQSGKTTVAGIVHRLRGTPCYAFADPIRALINDLGLPGIPDLTDDAAYAEAKANTNLREYMVALGKGAREHISPDVWVNATIDRILDDNHNTAVIADCRYANEVQAFIDVWGYSQVSLWQVTRNGAEPANAEEMQSLAAMPYSDYYIPNHGTLDQLLDHVSDVLRELDYKWKL